MYHGSQEHSLHLSGETGTGICIPSMGPTSSEGIIKLEKVKRQAARFVHGNYSEGDPGCVIRMVSDLGWETLESNRKKDRPTTLYKIRHRLVDMDTGGVIRLYDRHTTGQQRLYQPTASIKVYKDSFFPRTIQDWNSLPAVTDSPTIEGFRADLAGADSQMLNGQLCF